MQGKSNQIKHNVIFKLLKSIKIETKLKMRLRSMTLGTYTSFGGTDSDDGDQ